MTNQLTNALVKAGFPSMPLNKRIWLWVKDHPDRTTHDISAAIGINHNRASVALLDLASRGMVTRRKVKRRTSKGSMASTFEYAACIGEFELLPVRKSFEPEKSGRRRAGRPPSKANQAANDSVTAALKAPAGIAAIPSVNPAAAAQPVSAISSHGIQPKLIDVKPLPLKDAFSLWKELCQFFGAPEGLVPTK